MSDDLSESLGVWGGDPYEVVLPTGDTQQPLDYLDELADKLEAEIMQSLEDDVWIAENTCTCGTFKAMGEVAPEMHSSWCDVYKNVERGLK
jgi:hypothetical protein